MFDLPAERWKIGWEGRFQVSGFRGEANRSDNFEAGVDRPRTMGPELWNLNTETWKEGNKRE
jgi:hypothetical protein